jgi:hypothetical protein
MDPAQVVHEQVDDEVIVIHLARGNYFSLAGSGTQIWTMLTAGLPPGEIGRSLAEVHSNPAEEIEAMVGAFVERLLDEDLLQAIDGADQGAEPSVEGRAVAADDQLPGLDPPRLEKYTDMQDYLLIDPIHEVEDPGWPARKPS